jgi:hypothetical protein
MNFASLLSNVFYVSSITSRIIYMSHSSYLKIANLTGLEVWFKTERKDRRSEGGREGRGREGRNLTGGEASGYLGPHATFTLCVPPSFLLLA